MRTQTLAPDDGAPRRRALLAAAAATLCAVLALHGPAARAQGASPGAPQDTSRDTSQEKAREPMPQPTNTTTRFDGDWTIRVDCPAVVDPPGPRAVNFDLPASVLNGKLFGSRGPQGTEGAVQIDGVIQPDGTAQLQARGRTGDPAFAVNHLPAGTAYSYDIQARFDDARGHGRRVQDRACDFGFTRR